MFLPWMCPKGGLKGLKDSPAACPQQHLLCKSPCAKSGAFLQLLRGSSLLGDTVGEYPEKIK